MLKYSKLEFAEYKKHGNKIHLQEAGEKLFNAFSRYLEIRYKRVTGDHGEIWNLANLDKNNSTILSQLDILHSYFYHGESYRVKAEQIEPIFKNVVDKVESRIKNLR